MSLFQVTRVKNDDVIFEKEIEAESESKALKSCISEVECSHWEWEFNEHYTALANPDMPQSDYWLSEVV